MSQDHPVRIGVALACFNRREKTRNCLAALYTAAAPLRSIATLDVVVSDDRSTDGTVSMLAEQFPDVEVIHGSGQLFWAGGMRAAFGRLLARNLDQYLWLNDDAILFPDALEGLLTTQNQIQKVTGSAGIVVGSTCDDKGQTSYGGLRRRKGRLGALSFERMVPNGEAQQCDTHNGNVVLISKRAATALGNLDAGFRHAMADMDYGLRARAAGIPVWVMPGYAGRCDMDHPIAGSFRDNTLPLSDRWRTLTSPKGLPFDSWLLMCKRHAGAMWPLHFTWPYARTVVSWVLSRLQHTAR